mmetsp:Transcript_38193/g.93670  ORF Transcript_38193/g.93670 Transcript_38193/m.93670 type:complete len:204 (-) Transcript_38193:29-640(-)
MSFSSPDWLPPLHTKYLDKPGCVTRWDENCCPCGGEEKAGFCRMLSTGIIIIVLLVADLVAGFLVFCEIGAGESGFLCLATSGTAASANDVRIAALIIFVIALVAGQVCLWLRKPRLVYGIVSFLYVLVAVLLLVTLALDLNTLGRLAALPIEVMFPFVTHAAALTFITLVLFIFFLFVMYLSLVSWNTDMRPEWESGMPTFG